MLFQCTLRQPVANQWLSSVQWTSQCTLDQGKGCVDCPKNNKSRGVDGIPVELLKSCKNESEWVTQVLNYIIEQCNFPESWSEGLRSSIYKAGDRLFPDSYREITILPIFEKIFEMAVYKRLSFVNEAFNKIDPSNGGFINEAAHLAVDKVFLHFARCILCVKATTSNAIVFGETGHLPPSLSRMISALTFANRLHYMSSDKMAERVFIELDMLHEQGFTTWMTKVLDLANDYNLDVKQNRHRFKYECKMVVGDRFISNWHNNLINTEINPGLRTYQTIKTYLKLESYLYLVREAPFCYAIAQIRPSSRTLAIERGRHSRPKTLVQIRLCKSCGVIEDEAHFILSCHINQSLRVDLMKNNESRVYFSEVQKHEKNEQISFIFHNEDRIILTWFGNFLHNSFMLRKELLS